MTNTSPETGIRYGVIAFNHLDGDLASILWNGGEDLTLKAALDELWRECFDEAEQLEEQVLIGISETDPHLRDNDRYVERKIEEMWSDRGFDGAEDYADKMVDQRTDQIQIDEPIIEGEYEGVKYRVGWLGGAPLLWVFEGPVGSCKALCSPCVPNAGDLDSGFSLEPDKFAWKSHVIPQDWLAYAPFEA